MEIKDLLTPCVTVLAVFLAAHFALRNEHKKKALEIETAQIERTAALVHHSLDNFAQYTGALAAIVDISTTMIVENQHPNNHERITINFEELHRWIAQIENDPEYGLNRKDLQQAAHGLRFHREANWNRWSNVVPLVHREIYDFFMITTPGKENIDVKDRFRTVEEARIFATTLRDRTTDLILLKEQLLSSMKADFKKLLQPKESLTFCSLLNGFWRWVIRFFNCRL
ncbi:hypothetical protein RM153_24050 (plasmid) [Pantoea agglomerans]|uniref:hypothetical protein n=1 Tax=Enterobacter agglomerans TaxID=549 RepID=UPI0028A12D33|nr:hypothetical protein [Pantoea agglomerans]WNK51611.1 hypothetical protein RM153_24050 [Pantoea agglomerans]